MPGSALRPCDCPSEIRPAKWRILFKDRLLSYMLLHSTKSFGIANSTEYDKSIHILIDAKSQHLHPPREFLDDWWIHQWSPIGFGFCVGPLSWLWGKRQPSTPVFHVTVEIFSFPRSRNPGTSSASLNRQTLTRDDESLDRDHEPFYESPVNLFRTIRKE